MDKTFLASVLDQDGPVSGIKVVLCCQTRHGRPSVQYTGATDFDGRVEIPYRGQPTVIFLDSPNYWTTEIKSPCQGVTIRTTRISGSAGPLAWWHEDLGVTSYDPGGGSGIKIGVVDTGLGEHEVLDHVAYYRALNINDEIRFAEMPRLDPDNHGTAVCGLIGGRLPAGAHSDHLCGIAPAAELFCVGVGYLNPNDDFEMPDLEIAEAVRFLVKEKGVDLINLSLTGKPNERIPMLREQINEAHRCGCLTICAAGNFGNLRGRQRSNVCASAKYRRAVAVAALGKDTVGPECQPSPYKEETCASWGENGYYLTSFSSRGPEIFCAAPGVTVIAPIDNREIELAYTFFEGTSFSAPLVCGTLALLLAASAKYRSLPRSARRANMARSILGANCRRTGLAKPLGGYGMPFAQAARS